MTRLVDLLVSYWPVWLLAAGFALAAAVRRWELRVERARRGLARPRAGTTSGAVGELRITRSTVPGVEPGPRIQAGGGFRLVEARPDPRARLAESTARQDTRPYGGCDNVVPLRSRARDNVVPLRPRGEAS